MAAKMIAAFIKTKANVSKNCFQTGHVTADNSANIEFLLIREHQRYEKVI